MQSVIIFAASDLYLVIVILAAGLFLLADGPVKWRLLKLAVIVFPLCFIVAQIASAVIVSPRPFLVEHIPALIPSATDNGFPSDHTLLVMAVAGIIFVVSRKMGVVLLVLAICVGIARVLAHVHHPIDILGSTVIALSITAVAQGWLVDKVFGSSALWRRRSKTRENVLDSLG